MRTLAQDLRYGWRVLLQRPAFTVVAVLALALGIGANTAIFSVVHAVLLQPMPYPHADRLMTVWDDNSRQGWPRDVTGYTTYTDWKAQGSAFESMAVYRDSGPTLTGEYEPQRLHGAVVSPEFFQVLGVKPALGRTIEAGEDREGAPAVAVLSHAFWQRQFGGEPAVIGKTIQLGDTPTTVIGVMPPEVRFPGRTVDVWLPLQPPKEPDRGVHYLYVIGRLKPGATPAEADAQLDAVMTGLARQFPQAYEGFLASVVPLHEHLVGEVRPALLMLLGAVLLVLLIACANVANLLLARTAAREREIALRTALGAGRWRLVRQMLTESALLGLAGGLGGLLLALWGGDLLVALAPEGVPRLENLSFSTPVLAFTLGLSLLTGVLFGLAPALQSSRLDLNESLKESRSIGGSARSRRLRGSLVAAQIAMALVLLIGAGLLIQSFLRLRAVEPGFNPDRLLAFSLSLPRGQYPEDQPIVAFHNRLLERLEALPGAESAAAVLTMPLYGGYNSSNFSIEGRPVPPPTQTTEAKLNEASPDYFETMQIGVVRGRVFGPGDVAGSPPVVVVNEAFVRRFFPGEEPLGKRFKWGTPESEDSPWREIVGIVRDARHNSLEQPSDPEVYMASAQSVSRTLTVAVRTTGEPADLAPAVRQAVRELDPTLAVWGLRTMDELLAESLAQRRFSLWLLGLFAAVALLLAAVGIYGVMSYVVTQRTREIGVRMALGARRVDVLRLVVGQGMSLALAGVALGLLTAIGLSKVLSGLLYGVGRLDPVTYAGVAALLTAVAALACYLPARRATKVDPLVALRHE